MNLQCFGALVGTAFAAVCALIEAKEDVLGEMAHGSLPSGSIADYSERPA
jgi:hypothetical protein